MDRPSSSSSPIPPRPPPPPPPSSKLNRRWMYDVFLNFRGSDIRNNFCSHLYDAFSRRGINAFIDNDLERGQEISPSLLEAIERSRIAMPIFSQHYASSSWCLDELVHIIFVCAESIGQTVMPIFYNVDPFDVMKQKGSYGECLNRFTRRVDVERIQRWKSALHQAANFSGWHLDYGNEAAFIRNIVKDVLVKLDRPFLHVADFPVGLDSYVDNIITSLSMDLQNTRLMVAITGIGGIGKSTVLKAVYNQIANQFEGSSFLAYDNEIPTIHHHKAITRQQEIFLAEILGDNIPLRDNCNYAIRMIEDRLRHKRVLICIDNASHVDHLRMLVGPPKSEWFHEGSRIIFTTRDKHLVDVYGIKAEHEHEVKELCRDDALKLFSWNAFGKSQPEEDFKDLTSSVLDYAKGLPLALVVLGSFLLGKSKLEWESELEKWEQIPKKEIMDILKISFDSLEDNEKAIFLDVAFFFRGMQKDYVIEVLKACDFSPISGIQVLIKRCLMYIDYNNHLQMHDLLQSMGRDVVRRENPDRPDKRSRLWFHNDILPVLEESLGTRIIQGIKLDASKLEEVHLRVDADVSSKRPIHLRVNADVFSKMPMLRVLEFQKARVTGTPENLPNHLRFLAWHDCPLESLPSKFYAAKLVVLDISGSCVKHLGFPLENCNKLITINFRDCKYLADFPDLSTVPNLKELYLDNCTNLKEIHKSMGYLEKLNSLSLENCSNLGSLPSFVRVINLRYLRLSGCLKLDKFPDVRCSMTYLEELYLRGSAIQELPQSIGELTGLKHLDASTCEHLQAISISIFKLKHLETLNLYFCQSLYHFPNRENEDFKLSKLTRLLLPRCKLRDADFLEAPFCFPMLEEIDLSYNDFITLPQSICRLYKLRSLELNFCSKLSKIPDLPRSVKTVSARNCLSLKICEDLGGKGEHCSFDFSNCSRMALNMGIHWTGKLLESMQAEGPPQFNRKVEVFLPGSEMPDWVSHFGEDGIINFQVPSSSCLNIIGFALCLILKPNKMIVGKIVCRILMNAQEIDYLEIGVPLHSLESEHVWLCYLPSNQNQRFKSLMSLYQNRFQVIVRNTSLKMCGVCVLYPRYVFSPFIRLFRGLKP